MPAGGWDGSASVIRGDDCDDHDASVYPGAPARCDGIVNACGATLSEDETDDDPGGGDGYVECVRYVIIQRAK